MGIDPIARVGRYGGGRVRSRAREARASHRAREMTFSRVVSACTQGTHANVQQICPTMVPLCGYHTEMIWK
jgi:hypothetical protein